MATQQNINDSTVLLLQKEVDKQKAEIKKIKFHNPKTNCTIQLGNNRYNLHVIDLEVCIGLTTLLIEKESAKIEAYKRLSDVLPVPPVIKIEGYIIDDWIHDIKNRIRLINKRATEQKLKKTEEKLKTLLSENKRTELELESIKNELGL